MLTSKQRSALRKEANTLSPVFQIGKDGIDEAVIAATSNCLTARELAKFRVLETCPLSTGEVAAQLAEATSAELVQVIGRIIVLFCAKKNNSAFDAIMNPQAAAKAASKAAAKAKAAARAKIKPNAKNSYSAKPSYSKAGTSSRFGTGSAAKSGSPLSEGPAAKSGSRSKSSFSVKGSFSGKAIVRTAGRPATRNITKR